MATRTAIAPLLDQARVEAASKVKTFDDFLSWLDNNESRGRPSKYRIEVEHFLTSNQALSLKTFTKISTKGKTPSEQAAQHALVIKGSMKRFGYDKQVAIVKRQNTVVMINLSLLTADQLKQLKARKVIR